MYTSMNEQEMSGMTYASSAISAPACASPKMLIGLRVQPESRDRTDCYSKWIIGDIVKYSKV